MTSFAEVLAWLLASHAFAVAASTSQFGPILTGLVADLSWTPNRVTAVAITILICWLTVCPEHSKPQVQAEAFIWERATRTKVKVKIEFKEPDDKEKPCWLRPNESGLPQVFFSASRHGWAALHILFAQQALGKPTEIAMDCDKTRSDERRRQSQLGYPKPGRIGASGWQRDEYPPATCEEGGIDSTTGRYPSIMYIPAHDNRSGGTVWRQACALYDGQRVEVCVMP